MFSDPVAVIHGESGKRLLLSRGQSGYRASDGRSREMCSGGAGFEIDSAGVWGGADPISKTITTRLAWGERWQSHLRPRDWHADDNPLRRLMTPDKIRDCIMSRLL